MQLETMLSLLKELSLFGWGLVNYSKISTGVSLDNVKILI